MYRDGARNHQLIATRTENLLGHCERLEWSTAKAANHRDLSCGLLIFAFGWSLSHLGSKCILTLLPFRAIQCYTFLNMTVLVKQVVEWRGWKGSRSH